MIDRPTASCSATASGLPSGSRTEVAPLVSVIIPMKNEATNAAPLLAEIAIALGDTPHEVICVDDGGTDGTDLVLAAASAADPRVQAFRHAVSCGQSAAIVSGVRAARGRWIATLDGDGQNDPADLPRLLARAIGEAGALGDGVLVAGHRVNRRDTRVKRVTSRIANRIRAGLLGDATPDTGCGLKVFPRRLFLEMPAFDHMHRYLPALALRAGARVVSEPVNHRPRLRGRSNYGTLDRLLVAFMDLVGVIWLQRRWRRPIATRLPPVP